MTLKALLFIGILILGIGASFTPIINLDITQKEMQAMRRETVHDSQKMSSPVIESELHLTLTLANFLTIWIIYYYAPQETAIRIRYQLEFTNDKSEKVKLNDIYGYAP